MILDRINYLRVNESVIEQINELRAFLKPLTTKLLHPCTHWEHLSTQGGCASTFNQL